MKRCRKRVKLKSWNVFTADMFYNDQPDWETWARYGVFALSKGKNKHKKKKREAALYVSGKNLVEKRFLTNVSSRPYFKREKKHTAKTQQTTLTR